MPVIYEDNYFDSVYGILDNLEEAIKQMNSITQVSHVDRSGKY